MLKTRYLLPFGAALLFLPLVGSPQAPPENHATHALDGIKFGLSESEGLKLENLRLKKQLIEEQTRRMQAEFTLEVDAYVAATLEAHGNPKGVRFDGGSMGFIVPLTDQK